MLVPEEIAARLKELKEDFPDPGTRLQKRHEIVRAYMMEVAEEEVSKIQDIMSKNFRFLMRKNGIYSTRKLASAISIQTGFELGATFLNNLRVGKSDIKMFIYPVILAMWFEIPVSDFMFVDMEAKEQMKWDLLRK